MRLFELIQNLDERWDPDSDNSYAYWKFWVNIKTKEIDRFNPRLHHTHVALKDRERYGIDPARNVADFAHEIPTMEEAFRAGWVRATITRTTVNLDSDYHKNNQIALGLLLKHPEIHVEGDRLISESMNENPITTTVDDFLRFGPRARARVYAESLNEARDYPLYHWMDERKAFSVFQTDRMDARWMHTDLLSDKNINGNSFSRDKNLYLQKDIRIIVDGRALSQTNKIIPLDAESTFRYGSFMQQDYDPSDPGSIEDKNLIRTNLLKKPSYGADRNKNKYSPKFVEEFVIGDIKPLHRYIRLIEINSLTASNDLIEACKTYSRQYKIPIRMFHRAAARKRQRQIDYYNRLDEMAIYRGRKLPNQVFRWITAEQVSKTIRSDAFVPGDWHHNIPGIGKRRGISLGYDPARWDLIGDVCFVLNGEKLDPSKAIEFPGIEVHDYTYAKIGQAHASAEQLKKLIDEEPPNEIFYLVPIRPLHQFVEKLIVEPTMNKNAKSELERYADTFRIPLEFGSGGPYQREPLTEVHYQDIYPEEF